MSVDTKPAEPEPEEYLQAAGLLAGTEEPEWARLECACEFIDGLPLEYRRQFRDHVEYMNNYGPAR